MKTNKKAISLIVLVITIIVLAILAATVIISLSNTNIIEQANKTSFKSDMSNYKEAASLYVASEMARLKTGDSSGINLVEGDENYTSVFGEVPDKYEGKLSIVSGRLVYETEVESEIDVLEEMGIVSSLETELAPGLYEAGTTNLLKSWDELISGGDLTVTNGVLYAATTYVEELGMDMCTADVYGDLVIPSTVTKIGGGFTGGGPLSVVIPDSVTEIQSYAFAYGNLTSIVISNSVTSIESYAFDQLYSFTDVYYTGTEEEWNSMNISIDGNDSLLSATMHFEHEI